MLVYVSIICTYILGWKLCRTLCKPERIALQIVVFHALESEYVDTVPTPLAMLPVTMMMVLAGRVRQRQRQREREWGICGRYG